VLSTEILIGRLHELGAGCAGHMAMDEHVPEGHFRSVPPVGGRLCTGLRAVVALRHRGRVGAGGDHAIASCGSWRAGLLACRAGTEEPVGRGVGAESSKRRHSDEYQVEGVCKVVVMMMVDACRLG
jgi:hypothetical protein